MLEPETTASVEVGAELGGPGFLEVWYDPLLRLPPYLDRKVIIGHEVDRLARALSVCTIAGSIPRRLGPDAGAAELALDKKRARRVNHALLQSLKKWQGRLPKFPLDDNIQISGAHLVWEEFGQAHALEVQGRARLVATWAVRTEDQKWGRSAIVRYQNEVKWLLYALRD